jgi:hypothetical protein
MGKTFNPEKFNMAFCPLCKGNGKLPKNPGGFDVCRKCGVLDSLKKERKRLEKKKIRSK